MPTEQIAVFSVVRRHAPGFGDNEIACFLVEVPSLSFCGRLSEILRKEIRFYAKEKTSA